MRPNVIGAIIIIVALVFCAIAFSQTTSTEIYGKSDTGVLTWENVSGRMLNSVSRTGTSGDIFYEITVKSSSADSGGVALVRFKNLLTRRVIEKYIAAVDTDSVTISNFKLAFNDTLAAGNISTIHYTTRIPVKVDTTGGLHDALWDYVKADTVTSVSATPDTTVLIGDYPLGLTVLANVNLQFRTNRISGWIFLQSGNNIFIPIRHVVGDTFFVKTATIPNVVILRGK